MANRYHLSELADAFGMQRIAATDAPAASTSKSIKESTRRVEMGFACLIIARNSALLTALLLRKRRRRRRRRRHRQCRWLASSAFDTQHSAQLMRSKLEHYAKQCAKKLHSPSTSAPSRRTSKRTPLATCSLCALLLQEAHSNC